MPSKLNSEFNYRYQVIGETVWEKIKTLKGFLEGRIRAAALQQVSQKKYQALVSKLNHLRATGGLEHEILELEADIIEADSHRVMEEEAYELNRQEIECLQSLLAEYYEIAEPTRIPGYSDEQMFEANAANEFTAMIGKEIYAEILAHGHPSPAKLRNAMSNPVTWNVLKAAGLIPKDSVWLLASADPLKIALTPESAVPTAEPSKLTNSAQ